MKKIVFLSTLVLSMIVLLVSCSVSGMDSKIESIGFNAEVEQAVASISNYTWLKTNGAKTVTFTKLTNVKLADLKSTEVRISITAISIDDDAVTFNVGGTNTTQYLTVLAPRGNDNINKVTFADGVVYTHALMMKNITFGESIIGTSANDSLVGGGWIEGLNGSDNIVGNAEYGANKLFGGNGNDTIAAIGSYNVVNGGNGIDSIRCAGESEVIFDRYFNADNVLDPNCSGMIIKFTYHKRSSVVVSRSGYDLLLRANSVDTARLVGYFGHNQQPQAFNLQKIIFADGVILTISQINKLVGLEVQN